MSIYGNPVLLGGGGGEKIPLLARAEWNLLSMAQKRTYGYVAVRDADSGYDRGELYFGEDAQAEIPLIPAMTGYTTPGGEASASSYFMSGFEAWKAFNGTQGSISTLSGCWLAGSSDAAPCLTYAFAVPSALYSLWLELMNNSTAYAVTAYIEGLASGGTWEKCLAEGSSVTLSFPYRVAQTYTFDLNGSSYAAIRIRGAETWYKGAGATACGFSRVQVYTD